MSDEDFLEPLKMEWDENEFVAAKAAKLWIDQSFSVDSHRWYLIEMKDNGCRIWVKKCTVRW